MKIGNFEFHIPKVLVWSVIIGAMLIFVVSTYGSFNNKEVKLRTTFNMQMKNRTALFDKMWKIISQKAQVAKAYDSSFIRIVKEAMDARKDGANIMMKWVTESNPTLQANTVQELYKDLSRTIESERNSFFEREETLSSIQQQHSQFLLSFPNNFYNLFMGRKELEYKPITSGRTDEVISTGQDNDVKTPFKFSFMVIWFAMLIPIVASAMAYYVWGKKFVWWEFLIPMFASFIFILITKFAVEKSLLNDTEYRGGIIVEARYYEYWETWVSKTCSERYACGTYTTGTGSNRTTHTKYCTRYYDCSYCDRNSAYWMVYDDQGHSWSISEKEYFRLMKQWKATPEFVELDRNIRYRGSCGKDGDMYRIRWNNDILTSETSSWTASYDNHVQVSKSNFDLKDVSKKDAKKYGLYDYPDLNRYYQPAILGLDSMNFLTQPQKNGTRKMFDYFNGNYGPKRKIRLFVLLFNDKPIDVAIKQKNYWIGGNKNELVVCIGLDKNTGKLNWVYPFTWTENKRIAVDVREDVMNLGTLNFTNLYYILDDATKTFTYRDFNQYNYLSVDPPTWGVWFVYIMTFIISFGALYYGYVNEFEAPEDPRKNKPSNGGGLKDYRE